MANFSFQVQEPIKTLNPINLDYWQGPWVGSSLSAAITNATNNIPSAVRYQGMKVILAIRTGATEVEYNPELSYTILQYWFKDDKTTLVPFTPDKDVNALGAAAGVSGEIQFNINGTLTGSSGFYITNANLNNNDTQLVIRRNLSSPVTVTPGSRLWVDGQIVTNAGLTAADTVKASRLSGSLTKLADGTSYLIQGTGISISSGTNGAVTISSTAVTSPAGSNTQVQFNNNNAFSASPNLTFNTSTNTLATQNVSLAGNLTFNTVGEQSITHVGDAFQNLLIRSINAAVNVEGTYFDNERVHMFGDLTASADINLAKYGDQIIRKSDMGNLSIFSENGTVLVEGTVFDGKNVGVYGPLFSTSDIILTHEDHQIIRKSGTGNLSIFSENGTVKVEETVFDGYNVGINGLLFSTSDIKLTKEGHQTILKDTDAGVFAITSSKGPITINGNTFSANDIYPTTAGSTVNLMNQNATTLRLGAGSTGGITIGSDSATATPVKIGGGTGNIDIGTGAQARSVNLGTGAAAQSVTVGSANGASSLKLQSGTGNTTIDSSGTVLIGQSSAGANAGVIGVPSLGSAQGSKITFGTFAANNDYGEIGHYNSLFNVKTKKQRDLVITSVNGGLESRMLVLKSSQGDSANGQMLISGDLVVGMDESSNETGNNADIYTYKNTMNIGAGSPNLQTLSIGITNAQTNLLGTISINNVPNVATTNNQILTRNSTNGNIEYTNVTLISDEINLGVIYALSTYNYVP